MDYKEQKNTTHRIKIIVTLIFIIKIDKEIIKNSNIYLLGFVLRVFYQIGMT